jgi:deoxyribodipyrimidine photo-lyase
VKSSIVWLRRDLRLADNVALYEACAQSGSVCLAFVLDPALLRGGRVGAPIVQGFFEALRWLRARLRELGSDLALLEGECAGELSRLACRLGASAVFYNEDYEPDAIRRDAAVTKSLQGGGIEVQAFLDHVYFGADEVEREDGRAYKVFTPYRRRWLDRRHCDRRLPVPSARAIEGKLAAAATIGETREVPLPETYGYRSSSHYPDVSEGVGRRLLHAFLRAGGSVERYNEGRNFPALDGTSHLSPQLRAGTIGIRECVERAFARAEEVCEDATRASIETWISELVWREFYQMVLKRFPHVATSAFLEGGNRVPWRDSEAEFRAWCEGRSGYPIVDAAMRQLNAYGWMHNRLRMIVASFLTKDLLIDWRLGERYFEQRLADADLAQNNGGWQWAASTGTDAAPYFRIFNPVRQGKRFDPSGSFARSMLPELRAVPDAYVHEPWTMPPLMQAELRCEIGRDYPTPIVDHELARSRAIDSFAPIFRGSRGFKECR